MSLSTFLRHADVKERFAQEFPKPTFSLKKEIVAPPMTKRYSLVGTAFDYVLRFYVERLNPTAVTRTWVAETAVGVLSPHMVIDGETRQVVSFTENALTKKAQRIVERAKQAHLDYLCSGEMADEVLESCLLLAQLDPIVRAGYVDENLGTVYKEDVVDLRNLVSSVDPNLFQAKRLCVLNPTFGEASVLVGGADADLVIDDTLIDVKTTKSLRLSRAYVNELIGYYILFRISGGGAFALKRIDEVDSFLERVGLEVVKWQDDHYVIEPVAPKGQGAPYDIEPWIAAARIERLGIYYSRHAELYTFPVEDIVDQQRLPAVMEWFKQRAASCNPRRAHQGQLRRARGHRDLGTSR